MVNKAYYHIIYMLQPKMGEKNFELILDVYKSHINDQVKKAAKDLGIRIIFVPASGTEMHQPFDIKAFGIKKAY